MQPALKSVDLTSGRKPGSIVVHPDERTFSLTTDSLRMTASSKLNSNTDSRRNQETSGNITGEASELLVNEISLAHRHSSQDHAISANALEYLDYLTKYFCVSGSESKGDYSSSL